VLIKRILPSNTRSPSVTWVASSFSVKQNNIRDAIASMMKEVCHDFKVEPAIIYTNIESAGLSASVIEGNEARADVVMDFGCDFEERSFEPYDSELS